MSEQELSKEARILQAMKMTLTAVIKDTATQPGLLHPLKEPTIDLIRDCLILISAREQELALMLDRPMQDRPRYVDEPRTEVAVPLSSLKIKSKPPN